VVDVAPGHPLENSLAGNTIDLCPVGALISRDFLYQARVWNTKKTDSLCAGCARGCNVEIQSLENRIVRLVPRENRAVNDWWMCDHGRYDYKYVGGPKRILGYLLPAAPGIGGQGGAAGASGASTAAAPGRYLAEGLKAIAGRQGAGSIAAIGSAFMTLEELWLLRKLLATLGSKRLGAIARPPGREERFKAGFVISADKNPNRRGAQRVLGPDAFEAGLADVLQGIERGEVRGLVLAANLPGAPIDGRLAGLLGRLEFLAVFLLEADPRLPATAAIFPATAFAEKDGAMVNDRNRVQRLRPAVALPRAVRSETDVLQEALVALGERRVPLSAGGVFRELAGEVLPEVAGRGHRDGGHRDGGHRDLGKLGLDLEAAEEAAARAAAGGSA
jgi:NADH-quinone oxidoreductase subunit G